MEQLLMIGAIVACVLLFSFAIFIHEFGHFLAAKLFGMRVDRFSIGFGPALWKRVIGGVEYRISAIPFGGYVALPQLDPEGTDTLQGGTENKPLQEVAAWKRIIVAFAGPFGNIVLAVILAFLLAAIPSARFGETPPVVGMVLPGGQAEQGGLMEGDRVLSVDGQSVRAWNDVCVNAALTGGREVPFVVLRGGKEVTLQVKAAYSEVLESYMLDAEPSSLAFVGKVVPGKAAEKAGLKPGDRIRSVNGVKIETFAEMRATLLRLGEVELDVGVERDGANLVLKMKAEWDAEAKRPMIGMQLAQVDWNASWMPSRSPKAQLLWDVGQITRILKGLVTPRESKAVAGALGGPVMIAQVLYRHVRRNIWDAVGFLRFVNVNLAILNLLPIPVLDGGLIFFALLELIFRRKPMKKLVDGLSILFMWFFLALMVFLVWRDCARSHRMNKASEVEAKVMQQLEQEDSERSAFKPAFEIK